MKVKISSLKSFIWLVVVILLMLSFPIQVVMSSPLPSLFPYIGIMVIFSITVFYGKSNTNIFKNNKKINQLIIVYVVLVIFHTAWQAVFDFISVGDAMSSIVIFIFPIIFYVYFSKYATKQEIRSVFIAISICGLISGIYFVFDSYSMLVLGKVNEFSYKMMNYSLLRSPDQAEYNYARISMFYRSHGLLEKHNISAAWISIGCFSALTIFSEKYTKFRITVITIFFSMLLFALNFTAIVAFLLVIIFVEFKTYSLLKGMISKSSFKKIALFLIIIFSASLLFEKSSDQIVDIIKKKLEFQINLARGVYQFSDETTFFGNLVSGFLEFPKNMLTFPPGILIGDGFSKWGVISKGGDYGHVDILHRLGLPLYIMVIVGLSRLIKLSLKKIHLLKQKTPDEARYLQFAVSLIVYILITTIHYNTWSVKSVLPLFFISIAVFSRFLSDKHIIDSHMQQTHDTNN